MADSDAAKGGSGAGKVRLDDIVARVIADPGNAQGATLLTGFIGKGDADGRIRIYPDISFGWWYDLAEDDVLHSIPLSPESSPLGGSRVWVKAGAGVKTGPSAQQQQPAAAARAAAAAVPFSIQPTCGIACTAAPPLCPPPPCTVATTLCPTVNDQTCAAVCQPTMVGQTCPNGDCTFFGTCPPPACTQPSTFCPTVDVQTCPPWCAQAYPAAAFAAPGIATFQGTTCPRNICTETIPPTIHHATCQPHICMTPPQGGGFSIQICAAAPQALRPTPTATFFHTCGAHCGWTVAQPTPTATFNPTQCTRCFICPPITDPATRTGVFNPFG